MLSDVEKIDLLFGSLDSEIHSKRHQMSCGLMIKRHFLMSLLVESFPEGDGAGKCPSPMCSRAEFELD